MVAMETHLRFSLLGVLELELLERGSGMRFWNAVLELQEWVLEGRHCDGILL